jgi:transcriptional regulator
MATNLKAQDLNSVREFINENTFGSLVLYQNNRLQGTQLPFFIFEEDAQIRLFGKIADPDASVLSLQQGQDVFCIFQGPYTYISPSWPAEPANPDWYHKTVQVNGKLNRKTGEEAAKLLIQMLEYNERNMEFPMKADEIQVVFEKTGIAGLEIFEVVVSDVETNYKLGQQLDDINFNRIIRELKKQDSYDAMLIGFEMEHYLKSRRKMQQ